MSYFIIIRGPAGVGKSTITKLLAKQLNLKIFHFDRIMTGFRLNYIQGEKWIPLHKFLKADRLMLPKFQNLLKTNNLVFEGNFYHKDHIEELIKNLNHKHYIFTLKAALKECKKRDKTRIGILGDEATEDVYKLVSAFDYGITIKTDSKSPEDIIKEIIHNLPKHLNTTS